MHSNAAEVQAHIRTYLKVGVTLLVATIITVAVSYVHLGTGGNITLALLIATIKASLVAAVFMHLSHERQWIYGSLILTFVFWVVLMGLPLLTTSDTFGEHKAPWEIPAAAAGDHAAGH
jgi:cytochrome c oxidase subunit 4